MERRAGRSITRAELDFQFVPREARELRLAGFRLFEVGLAMMYALEEDVLKLLEYNIWCAARSPLPSPSSLALLIAWGKPDQILYGFDHYKALLDKAAGYQGPTPNAFGDPEPITSIYLSSMSRINKFIAALVERSRSERNPIITFNEDWRSQHSKVISQHALMDRVDFVDWYNRLKEQCKQVKKLDSVHSVLDS